ncbi:aldolase [Megasphaera cerevisiae DSM 20462]|uniref:Aldolase n=1 Tax=Megasphaera cerevisiae DSM 20462 TaxID=1122219 RepID=A0A0J6ZQC0_9FIRM|nr:aldolase/citrate lyase family protein [Megasphaera cerevisiae]KMO87141.1 aldolase [Megasphaera cerevisiae DSM 20462]SJZ46444.1 4-hydroxy-2-oxoheptanedioate aldolase [Megasphaera cerevisiae DSM 20462]
MNTFKERLKNGEKLFGPFLNMNYPAVVEIAGLAGFDFVIIDNEHGEIPLEATVDLIRAAKLAQIPAIVRVYEGNPELVDKALDLGADGVQIPNIGSKEAAEIAVQAAKFAPMGNRGCNRFVRAGKYGSISKENFFGRANDKTAVVLQVEGQDGVQALPDILTVKGVDVLFVGPYDLSASLGIPGQVDHPKVIEQMEHIMEQAAKVGVAIGFFVDDVQKAVEWRNRGVQYVSFSSDVGELYVRFKENADYFKMH